MFKKFPKLPLIISVLLSINLKASGLPMPQSTTLPAPPAGTVDPQDVPLLGTILGLTVYQDYEDKNQYYYVPPFRILGFDQGAAGLMIHSVKVENIFKADQAMNSMQSEEEQPPEHIVNGPIVVSKRSDLERAARRLERNEDRFYDDLDKLKAKVSELDAELKAASTNNQVDLVVILTKLLADKTNEIAKNTEQINKELAEFQAKKDIFDAYVADCVEQWRRRKLYLVVTNLAAAGNSIDMGLYPKTEDLVVAVNNALDALKKTNGGFLSMSIYSGFTDRQINDITILKHKYWPHVKLSLLASNDLQFKTLAELQNSNEKPRDNTMFRSFKGAGGYHGATVNFDLTIDGAVSLSRALGPFILPVEITANITEKMLPFKATLDCNFTEGYETKGRADIRDGMVIYDKDMTNNIQTNDKSTGKCKLELIEGDPSSANMGALEELEKRLTEIHIRRTHLTSMEADSFYQRILSDLEHKRDTADGEGYTWEWVKYVGILGYGAPAVAVLKKASNFYWHTSIYDTARISQLKFRKEISYDGHQTIRKELPASLCLFYNAAKNAYDRCTRAQEEVAENPVKASEQAAASPACQGTKTLFDCATSRAQSAPELRPAAEEKIKDNTVELN